MSPKNKLRTQNSVKPDVKTTVKTIHQANWKIDDYVKIFHLTEEIKDKIKSWFIKILPEYSKDTIRILCPGVGAGRNEMIFIEELAAKYGDKQIECDFVDYSETSLTFLNDILKSKGFTAQNDYCVRKNIRIKIHKCDYEEWINIKRPQYDLIFAFFVINFLSNWQKSLLDTIKHLEVDGIFIVSQDLGDICFLDNTFYDKPDESDTGRFIYYNLWSDYYDERKKRGFDWNPVISPSNMNLIERMFSDICKLNGLEECKSKAFTWDLSNLKADLEHSDYLKLSSMEFWLNLIKGKSGKDDKKQEIFNCLSLPAKERIEISDQIEKKYYKHTVISDLKLGEKLIYLKRNSSVNFDTIAEYVIENSLNNISTLNRFKPINRFLTNKNKKHKTEYSADDNKGSLTLREYWLNRLFDLYNSSNLNKDNCSLSFLSRGYDDKDNNFVWRRKEIPVIFPKQFTQEKKVTLLNNYVLYFAFSEYIKKNKNISSLLTGLLYDILPQKIGLIVTAFEDREEFIEPVRCNNFKDLKAIRVNLDHAKYNDIKQIQDKITDRYILNKVPDLLKKLDMIDEEKHFFYIDQVYQVIDELRNDLESNECLSMFQNLFDILQSTGAGLTDRFISIVDNFMQVTQYTHLGEKIQQTIPLLYNQFLLGFDSVEWNTLYYTSTNSMVESGNTEQNTELGFYGTILYDRLEERRKGAIYENYDKLMFNTYIYSGMDGIYEYKEKEIKQVSEKQWNDAFRVVYHDGRTYLSKILNHDDKYVGFAANSLLSLLHLSRYINNPNEIHEVPGFQKVETFDIFKDIINKLVELFEDLLSKATNDYSPFNIGNELRIPLQLTQRQNSKFINIDIQPNTSLLVETYKEITVAIFRNLLVNAIVHNTMVNPFLNIIIKEFDNKLSIQIINSVTPDSSKVKEIEKYIEYMNNDLIEISFEKLGKTIIKQWCNHLQWKILFKLEHNIFTQTVLIPNSLNK